MKLAFSLRHDGPLNHAEAVGCFTANLALPGCGSLAAGKAVGYFQLAMASAGFLLSIIGAADCFRWLRVHGLPASAPDPGDAALDFFRHLWLPVLGIFLFLAALAWGVITGLRLLAAHPRDPT